MHVTRTNSVALLALANYLLVLLAGECFHDHGRSACRPVHLGGPVGGAGVIEHACSASGGRCAPERPVSPRSGGGSSVDAGVPLDTRAEGTGFCLTCRFLAQLSAPPRGDVSFRAVLCAQLILLPVMRRAVEPASQQLIRGPPLAV